jgi:hypothetical protein
VKGGASTCAMGRATLAIFLEQGNDRLVKQVTATCLSFQDGDRHRCVLVTPAHNIKVPLPGQTSQPGGSATSTTECKTFAVRAIVIFGESDKRQLQGVWEISADPEFLKEKDHFDVCPKSNNFKPEDMKLNLDYALIYADKAVNLSKKSSGGDIFSVLTFVDMPNEDLIEFISDRRYECSADYTVAAYRTVVVNNGFTWATHRQMIKSGTHPLFKRTPFQFTIRAWNPEQANLLKGQHERSKKRKVSMAAVEQSKASSAVSVPVDTGVILGHVLPSELSHKQGATSTAADLAGGCEEYFHGAPLTVLKGSETLLVGMFVGQPEMQPFKEGPHEAIIHAGLMFNRAFIKEAKKLSFQRKELHKFC